MKTQEDKKSAIASLLSAAETKAHPAPRPPEAHAQRGNVIQLNGGRLSAQQIVAGDVHNHITVVQPQIYIVGGS